MHQRTFVASFGIDTNVGQPATPVRTLGAALAMTDAGGEIVLMDSAGYGSVSINKSVSIVAAPGIYAGITVSTGNGIDVTAGVVTLRGLTINGMGGAIGINVGNAKVRIEQCAISNMAMFGIFANTANGEVCVRDTQVTGCVDGLRFEGPVQFALGRVRVERNNNVGLYVQDGARGYARDLVAGRNGNYGIGFICGAAGAAGYLMLDRALVYANGASGISAGIAAPVAGRLDLVVTNGTVVGNGADGIAISTQGAGTATAQVSSSMIDGNVLSGVTAIGAGASAIACGNRITRNGSFGLKQTGAAVVKTRQDNTLDGNNGGGAQSSGALTALAGV